MKNISFYMIGIWAFGFNAFADSTLVCREFLDKPGMGYQVELVTKPDTYPIAKVRFSKTGDLARLVCAEIEVDPTNLEATQPVLACFEEYSKDSGYSLILSGDTSSQKMSIVLSKVSFVGTEKIAELSCLRPTK